MGLRFRPYQAFVFFPAELPSDLQHDMYDWHEAFVDEQRSRAPISLTIYPLLNDRAPSSSFEASSSLIAGSNLEEDVENVHLVNELAHLEHQSTKCCLQSGPHLSSSTLPFAANNGNQSSASGAREFVQLNSASNAVNQRQSGSSIAYDDLRLYGGSSTSSTHSMKCDGQMAQQPPVVSIRPDSQLIFAPWNYKKKSGESEILFTFFGICIRSPYIYRSID